MRYSLLEMQRAIVNYLVQPQQQLTLVIQSWLLNPKNNHPEETITLKTNPTNPFTSYILHKSSGYLDDLKIKNNYNT